VKDIGTTRLEAFSDGVFAIAATLLVLEIDVNTTNGAQLTHALTEIWPSYLAYVTSFITIGIIWINHHHNMRAIERPDRTFMFINLLLLLDVAYPVSDQARGRVPAPRGRGPGRHRLRRDAASDGRPLRDLVALRAYGPAAHRAHGERGRAPRDRPRLRTRPAALRARLRARVLRPVHRGDHHAPPGRLYLPSATLFSGRS
jgi:hypothetical protein